MRYDLKKPCKNCPFRSDSTRIVFACRERAEEIEEQAYRRGFPCHLSAELVEEDDAPLGVAPGYHPGENTQYCAGHIIMQLNEEGDMPWPGINNDEDLVQKLAGQMDMRSPVFECAEDFFAANEGGHNG